MSASTRSKASASGAAGASGSAAAAGGDNPSPRRCTRRALKEVEGLRLAPGLPNSSNKRKLSRTVIIEYTDGAPAVFRTKAEEIRDGLLASMEQIEVEIDGQDERAGCFVVREVDGEVFVDLVGMVPNYTDLRNLVPANVVAGIVNAMFGDRVYRYNPPNRRR